MDTHLTVINPAVIAEREQASEHIRALHEPAVDEPGVPGGTTSERRAARDGRLADAAAVVMFATLLVGLVVLLVTAVR